MSTKPCACINHQRSYRPVIACKVHFTTSSSCALVDGSPSLLTLPSDTTSFARLPVGLPLVVMPDKNERNVALLEPTICRIVCQRVHVGRANERAKCSERLNEHSLGSTGYVTVVGSRRKMKLAVSDKQIETSPHRVAALLGEQRESNKDVQIAINIRTRPQKATIGSMKELSNEAARVRASRDRLLGEGERRRRRVSQ